MRLPIVMLLLCTGVAVYLLKGSRRGTGARAFRRNPGDSELNRVLAAQLARKTGFPEERIRAVLEGAQDLDIRRRIDGVLEQVTVTFSRQSSSDPHEAHLRILYKDGATVTIDYPAPWDQLPDAVRAEVLRTGKPECIRSWAAPWHGGVAST